MIAGVIRDDQGTPVAGARVYFTDVPGPTPDIAAVTGPDGSFSLGTPVDGTYTVECNAEGFAPARTTVSSTEPAPLELTLVPL